MTLICSPRPDVKHARLYQNEVFVGDVWEYFDWIFLVVGFVEDTATGFLRADVVRLETLTTTNMGFNDAKHYYKQIARLEESP